MKVNYVEFIYPGSFFSEISVEKCESTNPNDVVVPKRAFGFRFCVREEVESNGQILKGEFGNCSNWYFIGEKLSVSDVESQYPDKTTLIFNMKNNGYKHVCKTNFGQFIPMSKNDKIIR